MADIYPESRVEEILVAMINGEEYTKFPESRIEALLIELLGKIIEVEGRGAYEFKGSVDFDELPETLTEDMAGWTYNMAESFITDNRFVDGAGKVYSQGTNVSIANVGTDEDPDMMFDVPSAFVDVSAIYASINKVIADIAPEFSIESPYHENDLVIYNEILYIFTTDHAAGEFNPLEVEQTDISTLLTSVYNEIDLLAQSISGISESIPRNLSDLTEDSTHRTVTDTEKSAWNAKQDTLTFDDTPTASSTNPVTSDGIQKAITATAKTASGNPIVIQDAANVSAEALKLTLEPIQSGTGDPSPENVRPISGRTEVNLGRSGKNLFNPTLESQTYRGLIITKNADNTYSYSGKNDIEAWTGLYFGEISVADLPTRNIKLTGCPVGGSDTSYRLQADYYNGSTYISRDTDYGNGADLTIPANATVIKPIFYVYNNYQISGTLLIKPMIRDAIVADDTYEPYTGVTLTIALGQTVYGGNLDVKTGVLTITHKYDKITNVNRLAAFTTSPYGAFARVTNTGDCTGADPSKVYGVCSMCRYVSYNDRVSNTQNENRVWSDTGNVIYVRAANTATVEDVDDLFAIFENAEICYELATPTTVQLTGEELEMLKGYNYVTGDGDMVLSYQPDNNTGDIKSWTEQKIQSASEALDASKVDNSVVGTVENGTTASRAYAVGEHFSRNKKFCTAIASIASGATLTKDTNYKEGSIADSMIKQGTFSGITSVNGNVLIYNNTDRIILGVKIPDKIAIPFYTAESANARVLNLTLLDGHDNPVISTEVSGTYYYI